MLRLTPDLLEASYNFLKEATPFKAWRLASADDVQFHVMRTTQVYGDCGVGEEDGTYIIRISAGKNGYPQTLLATMGHEMIHLRQFMLGQPATHNDFFNKAARRVCRVLGCDPKTF